VFRGIIFVETKRGKGRGGREEGEGKMGKGSGCFGRLVVFK
jgi:hypothetical protein